MVVEIPFGNNLAMEELFSTLFFSNRIGEGTPLSLVELGCKNCYTSRQ